jgi:5-formyltetrahydrofolate cyclo-ligase
MEKSDLRRQALSRLKDLSRADYERHSRKIAAKLIDHSALAAARHVAVFDPLPSEPDITSFIAHLHSSPAGFIVCYPRCHQEELRFHQVSGNDQLAPVPGRKFREPLAASCPEIDPAHIDLIIVPGLAFARDGSARLGRGGGFYDRFLDRPTCRAATIAACFSCQLREDIPVETHDIPVQFVVTEAD